MTSVNPNCQNLKLLLHANQRISCFFSQFSISTASLQHFIVVVHVRLCSNVALAGYLKNLGDRFWLPKIFYYCCISLLSPCYQFRICNDTDFFNPLFMCYLSILCFFNLLPPRKQIEGQNYAAATQALKVHPYETLVSGGGGKGEAKFNSDTQLALSSFSKIK